MSHKRRVDKIAAQTGALRCPACCDGMRSWTPAPAVILRPGEPEPPEERCPECDRPRRVFRLALCKSVSVGVPSPPATPEGEP